MKQFKEYLKNENLYGAIFLLLDSIRYGYNSDLEYPGSMLFYNKKERVLLVLFSFSTEQNPEDVTGYVTLSHNLSGSSLPGQCSAPC